MFNKQLVASALLVAGGVTGVYTPALLASSLAEENRIYVLKLNSYKSQLGLLTEDQFFQDGWEMSGPPLGKVGIAGFHMSNGRNTYNMGYFETGGPRDEGARDDIVRILDFEMKNLLSRRKNGEGTYSMPIGSFSTMGGSVFPFVEICDLTFNDGVLSKLNCKVK